MPSVRARLTNAFLRLTTRPMWKPGLDIHMVLMSLARGKMPETIELIHKTMDGGDINLSTLSPKQAEYVKTARVLKAETLYSNAWLES